MPIADHHEKHLTKRSTLLLSGSAACVVVALTCVWGATQEHNAAQLTQPGPDTVAVSDDGRKIAPAPAETFRNHQCNDAPSGKKAESMDPSSLVIPSERISTTITPNADLSLPEAPKGILYSKSQPLGAAHGNTVTAGHVDYGPGGLSDRGGELSPWGSLHAVSPCDDVYATDAQGRAHHYRVTDKFTVPQKELDVSGIFSTTGAAHLVMVTCSGESVDEAGGPMQFHYDHNLVVMAQEVTA
ncbi:class F sortase [Kocuria sp. cx-455]|uniref:class F sortase n=1 Tax=Kocuria sp. cx-455 TaxID=2771377 RepID=UPI001689235C|nr:class F sortase [Kocuria sp. cx-455]MBD2766248.1 class F sortase [Kocuria sp. cx-455]